MDSHLRSLTLESGKGQFSSSLRAISALKKLGKPPSSLDLSDPCDRAQTALRVMAYLAYNKTSQGRVIEKQTRTCIVNNWLAGLYPWVELFLESVSFNEGAPRTVQGLRFLDHILVLPPLLLSESQAAGIGELQVVRIMSPKMFSLSTHTWFKVIVASHVTCYGWSNLIAGFLFSGEGKLSAEFHHILESPSCPDLASIGIRYMAQLIQHCRTIDSNAMADYNILMVLLIPCFYANGSHHHPFLLSNGTTVAVKTLKALVSSPITLERFAEVSDGLQIGLGIVKLLTNLLRYSLEGPLTVAEALDAGLLKLMFRAKHYHRDGTLEKMESPNGNVAFIFSRLLRRIAVFLVYPSIARQFLQYAKRISDSGLDQELGPESRSFLQHWIECRRKAESVRHILYMLKSSTPSQLCAYDLCPLAVERSVDILTNVKYLLCSRCIGVTYCSYACGRSNWPTHRRLCDLVSESLKTGRPTPNTMDRRFFDELLSTYVTRLHTDISDHLSSFNLPAVTYVHNGQQAVNRPVVILEFDSIDQEITLFSLGHLSIIDLGTAMRDERLAAGARMDTLHDTALGALGADLVVVGFFPMTEDFTSWPVIKVIRLWREVEVNEKFGHRHIMIKGTGVV